MPTEAASSAKSEAQVEVINYLISCLETRLGDRGGKRHEPGWEPRQHVVLGVLESTIVHQSDIPSQPEGETHSEPTTAKEEDLAFPDDANLPSMGLDFAVKTESGAEEIRLRLDVSFAIYGEEYPSAEEQRNYARPEEVLKPEGREGDSIQVSGKGEVVSLSASGSEHDTKAHRRPRTSLVSVWRRYDVLVSGIEIRVGTTAEHSVEAESLERAVRDVVSSHLGRPEAVRPFLARTREVPTTALADEGLFQKAIRTAEDPSFKPLYPKLKLVAFAERFADNTFLVSLSLLNGTILPKRPFQNLAAYDCQIHATVHHPSQLIPQHFQLAPTDYRYSEVSDTFGHGRGCVAVATKEGVRSTTLPRFDQRVVRPREDHVPAPRWAELGADPRPILDGIESAMHAYLEDWDAFLRRSSPEIARASHRERDHFEDEIRRFRLGRRAMERDSRLGDAFRLANEVFAELNKGEIFDTWRLFQVVFIVSHLSALAARQHRSDPEMLAELDYADVLWFPTGGGKTEAYLGLIVCALFYDRLRQKARGITSWLKFPLRMLSVQQFARVLRVLVIAERFRAERLGTSAGDPFELGYLVGGSNTPNSLLFEKEWWPGIKAAKALDQKVLDDHRLVAECPYCQGRDVHLLPDLKQVRLIHHCQTCKKTLPIYMTDDEVYRYMPSILVGTVDKLSGLAYFGEYTQFAHGPRFRCPTHGWFTFGRNGKCLAGDLCAETTSAYTREFAESWYDATPALVVQDELHLLREELGAFDAHYEGLFAELQNTGPSGLPSKILAASATIEQFEDQLRQVYGRKPRSFPTPGFQISSSFYTEEIKEPRRIYIGVLPHYRRKADVAGIVQTELLERVRGLEDMPPDEALKALGVKIDSPMLADLLFLYEVSLAFVNSKANGDQIADELARLSERLESSGRERVFFKVLTGQVGISELAAAIDHIEQDKLASARSGRLQALVGTSVVSHGVDLARLNVMTMAGLPPRVADYIQATSRSGRTHVGLVVTVFDSFSRRERSTFANFLSFHRFLDRMVEPAPVNKYSRFGADRTLPGIIMGLLWDLCRDETLGAPLQGIRRTRWLSTWWKSRATDIKPRLAERLERAYRSFVQGVNERPLEDDLVERVLNRWTQVEMPTMERFDADLSVELFRELVLSSFRDVDIPVDFGARPLSETAFTALTGTRLEGEGSDAA
jgi:hypothetical protein